MIDLNDQEIEILVGRAFDHFMGLFIVNGKDKLRARIINLLMEYDDPMNDADTISLTYSIDMNVGAIRSIAGQVRFQKTEKKKKNIFRRFFR